MDIHNDHYLSLRKELRHRILKRFRQDYPGQEAELHKELENEINTYLLGKGIGLKERRQLTAELYNAFSGLDILQTLMDDPGVSEIMVNGPGSIFVERGGKIENTDLRFDDAEHLNGMLRYVFSRGDKNLSLSRPIADLRMADGSRANAVLPPIARDGPVLTIRKFCGIRPDEKALLDRCFLSLEMLNQMKELVRDKHTLFICGGTGTGKTTLLNILSHSIPHDERIITIEDSAELQLNHTENWVRLESRDPGPDGTGGVGIDELIRCALRMRPDRIIVGEVRGREAAELLNAMNTGHPGTLCTAHANSCVDLLRRLSHMILAATRLPYNAVLESLSHNIDYIVHIRREADGYRHVSEFSAVVPTSGSFSCRPLYRWEKGQFIHV